MNLHKEKLKAFYDNAKYKVIAEIGDSKLERLITDFFQEEIDKSLPYYEFAAFEQLSNDSKKSFDIRKTPKYDWEQSGIEEEIKRLKTEKKWEEFQTDELLSYMCQQGALPESV